MATLAADTQPVNGIKGDKTYSFKVKNSTAVYLGGLQCLSAGFLKPFAAATGEIPIGRLEPTPDPTGQVAPPLTGNTSATPVPEGTICMEEEILVNVPVAGVTAQTDVGSLVYLSTDNLSADLTLTRPSLGLPVGFIVRWYSLTKCDVLRFSAAQLATIALGGNAASVVTCFSGVATGLDDADADFTIMCPPFKGTITAIGVGVQQALAGGTSFIFTPKIGSTLATGSATVNTTATTGGTAGDYVVAAVTAGGGFNEGSALKINLDTTGTFTGGSLTVFLKVVRNLGV